MKFTEYYFRESEAKQFANEVRIILEDESPSIGIDSAFIAGMCNYLEKRFPNYGDFDVAVGNEIRKYMKGDNSYVKKVKKRIHEIITKAKGKFLHDVYNKVEKIKIQPKRNPQQPPPMGGNPLMSDEPTAGESPGVNY